MANGTFEGYLEEQLLIKYFAIMHLILLKIQNTMDIKNELLQWFTYFLMRKLQVLLLKVKQYKMKN